MVLRYLRKRPLTLQEQISRGKRQSGEKVNRKLEVYPGSDPRRECSIDLEPFEWYQTAEEGLGYSMYVVEKEEDGYWLAIHPRT